MTHRVVQINWTDSKGVGTEWRFRDGRAALPPESGVSVGIVLDDTPEYITITMTLFPTQYFAEKSIPKCAITQIVELGTFEIAEP